MENTLIIPQTGINKDQDDINLSSQEYKYALNACIEDYDGNTYSLQNEQSNIYVNNINNKHLLNHLYIPSLEITLLFTTDNKGIDKISYFNSIHKQNINIEIKDILITNFNWDLNNRLHVKYKITDCTLNLYFVDGFNPDRFIYFNLDNYTLVDDFKKIKNNSNCTIEYLEELDINKTLFNQLIEYPSINLSSEIGGSLVEGVYQFFIAYSTSKGIPLSNYNSSNIFPIFENVEKQNENQEYITNKCIKININNITSNSYYKFINIVVAKTINSFTVYENIATLPINNNISYIYTGNNKGIISSEQEVLSKYPYYENSKIIEVGNNYLFKANISEFEKINIQRIANKIKLEAVTIKVNEDFYKNPENSIYKSLMRDEVYSFGLELITKEGEITGVGHIPNRESNTNDIKIAQNINDKINNNVLNWQVNNTAYKTSELHSNEIWETFDFAYWESTEKYPNNYEIWGDLCGKPIRHHKTPDCSISHIHDGENIEINNLYNKSISLFPMGIRLKNNIEEILNECVNENIISQKQKDRIVGYRIIRGDRSGQKSIIAKGLLYDMWNYEKPSVYNENDKCATKQKYYFPSIGFNDLRPDPFLSKDSEHYKYEYFDKGIQKPNLLEFENTRKYTFHSPDTSYVQPTLGNILKLETEEYGQSKGYFNICENQAEYKLLSYQHYNTAILIARFIANNTDFTSDNASSTGSSIGGLVGSAIPGVGTAIGSLVGGFIGSLTGGDDDVTSIIQKNSIILYQTEKILQLFKNVSDYQKLQYQYQAVGKYKGFKSLENNGNRQRTIINKGYLNSYKQSINNVFINNFDRESSVFIEIDKSLKQCSIEDNSKNKLTDVSESTSINLCKKYSITILEEAFNYIDIPLSLPPTRLRIPLYISFQDCTGVPQRWQIGQPETRILTASIPPTIVKGMTIKEIDCPECKSTVFKTKDCDCKGSEITNTISSFYGSIKTEKLNQYGNIFDIQYIDTDSKIIKLNEKIIHFGGDTFITPHSFKRKHSYFNNTTFNLPNDTDIFYQDLGNVAYPTYFFNTKENEKNIKPNTNLLFDLLQFGNYADSTYTFFGSLFGTDFDAQKATSILRNFSNFVFDPLMWIKPPNFYLDCYDNNLKSKPLGLFTFSSIKGIMYLYNYAIPYFYCESDVNTYFRHSKNIKEYDFYPHQLDLNYWLQEKNVSIKEDNYYFYNKDYSKQNKQSFHFINDINFKPKESCKKNYPNRIIYSLPSSEIDNNDLRDNYLIYRALDYYDFSQKNGNLTGIHTIESDKILVSFENNTQIFSAYNTIESSQGSIQIGNGGIFRSKPQEFTNTTLGYFGSQNSCFLSTEFGHIMVDAKRGQVFLIGSNGNGITDLTKDKVKNWFKYNLPFNISKYYNINTDNNFNNIGLHLCFDKRFNRFFITKLDYEPINKNNIQFINNKFYNLNNEEVSLNDKNYFYNKGFTISYSFITNSFISYHSFTPNYYIENINYFLSNNNNDLWVHNLSENNYQTYYNKLFPFEIELTDKYNYQPKVLQSISYIMDSIIQEDNNRIYDFIGFNKAIIYNNNQSSGLLLLDNVDTNNLFLSKKYPILEKDYSKIIQTNKENLFSFNQFKNRANKKELPLFLMNENNTDKIINPLKLDITKICTNFDPIRNNINYIKLIQDKYSIYKFIFKLANFKQNFSTR